MFTSNNDDEQTLFDNQPFEHDISPTYKPDNLSFSFFHFSPATFFDQDDVFFQSVVVDSPADSITTTMAAAEEHQHDQTQSTKMAAADDPLPPPNSKTNSNNKKKSASTRKIPKRRVSGKKDRHSKIITAQGPRDRRMRLSLPIAREFFSLQDMLGVDKPSKTVQWLLTMSKSAIQELTVSLSNKRRIHNKYQTAAAGTGSASKSTTTGGSSMSECEVVSETVVVAYQEEEQAHDRQPPELSKRKSLESSISTPDKAKKIKTMRKITYHPLARESRAKARARARERTIEKMQSQRFTDKSKQCVGENLDNDLKKVTSTSKEAEESAGSGTYDMKSTLDLVSSTDEVMKHSSPSMEHQDNVHLEEEPFMITNRKASSSSIFSYHNGIGLMGTNNNSNNSTSALNFSEMWDFTL